MKPSCNFLIFPYNQALLLPQCFVSEMELSPHVRRIISNFIQTDGKGGCTILTHNTLIMQPTSQNVHRISSEAVILAFSLETA